MVHFMASLRSPTDATLGYYSISIAFPKNDGEYGRNSDRSRDFLVAEYRLPEYQVTLNTAEEREIVRGETATVELEGKYFFGGPLSNADGDFTVYATPYVFDYSGDGYYDFSSSSSYRGWYERIRSRGDFVAEGSLRTDAAGVAKIELGSPMNDEPGSQRLACRSVNPR